MDVTIEKLKKHKINAISILEEEMEYDTAKVTETAFDLLIWFKETRDKILEEFDYSII